MRPSANAATDPIGGGCGPCGRDTAAAPDKRKPNLRPLASLLPYVDRYRGRALAALGALVLAALTTLVVPIAVRRMIDFGFTARGHRADQQLFPGHDRGGGGARLRQRARYYLVTTLGERIVADLRGDVFAHLTALSAASSTKPGPAR